MNFLCLLILIFMLSGLSYVLHQFPACKCLREAAIPDWQLPLDWWRLDSLNHVAGGSDISSTPKIALKWCVLRLVEWDIIVPASPAWTVLYLHVLTSIGCHHSWVGLLSWVLKCHGSLHFVLLRELGFGTAWTTQSPLGKSGPLYTWLQSSVYALELMRKGWGLLLNLEIHIDNFADDSGLGCSFLNCLHIQFQTCEIALKFLALNLDFVRFGTHCLLPSLH